MASGPSPRGTSPLASTSCSQPHHSGSAPVLLATAAPHYKGQVPGSISWLQTLWLAGLWLSWCPKAAKICRIGRELLRWSSHHASPIAQPSNSVFVLPHPEMLSIILIPLSSYDLLTLFSSEKLSSMQSTIKTKLTSYSTRASSTPAALPLSIEYFLLSHSPDISLPTERARSAEHGGCSALVGSEILWRSLLPQ